MSKREFEEGSSAQLRPAIRNYELVVPVTRSSDPNDIVGPGGYGSAGWVAPTDPLRYTVRFENDETRATAPAQRVRIELTLDEDLDARSFRLGSFGFGGRVFDVPDDRAYYQTRLQLADEIGVDLDVIASVDVANRKAIWVLQSLDRSTGLPPTDATKGFLPPDSPEGVGQGFVTYSVRSRDGATSGKIDAVARIYFDTEPPIDTPVVSNALDGVRPTSSLTPLAATTEGRDIVLSWTAADPNGGAGLKGVDLYVAIDSGTFNLVRANIVESTFVYQGQTGHRYGFYTLAIDNAGNRESAKSTAEATTLLVTPGVAATITVSATPTTLFVGSPMTGAITVTVRDGRGDPLSGQTVTLTTSLGQISPTQVTTDANGVATVTLSPESTPGTAVVSARVGDLVAANPANVTLVVDTVTPVTTATTSPPPPVGGVFTTDVAVTLSATDTGGSGVREIVYGLSGAQTVPSTVIGAVTTVISITADGQTTVTYFARDEVGNVEAEKTVVVQIERTVALTVTGSGTGVGTVTSSPAGIDCGTDCSEHYARGTQVTLTAVPSAGSAFGGWSGACTGMSTTCTMTMDQAKAVTATFVPHYALTVSRSGSGTVSSDPAGITCGTDCNEAYGSGTQVTLTAVPATGFVFTGWSDACTNSTGTCTVTMDVAKSVTATFKQVYALTVVKAGTGTGTVTSIPTGINCGADCDERYDAGTVVTLTASPASGSTFNGWSGACTGTTTCQITMSAARSVTATFNRIPPPVVGGHGFGITPGATSIALRWTGGTAQAGYALFRSPPALWPLQATATSYTDAAPAPGMLNCYILLPFDSAGAGLGNGDVLCAQTGVRSPSGGPGQLTLRLNESSTASLSWTPPGGQTGYYLLAVPLDGSPQRYTFLPAATTSTTDDTGGVFTCYMLIAVRTSGARNSDLACGLPGAYSFPTAAAAAGAAASRAGPTQSAVGAVQTTDATATARGTLASAAERAAATGPDLEQRIKDGRKQLEEERRKRPDWTLPPVEQQPPAPPGHRGRPGATR